MPEEVIKITEVTSEDESDFRNRIDIEISDDPKMGLSFIDGEPEDNNLMRGFSDCYGIFSLLKKVYELGKAGKEITFTQIEEEW